MESTYSIATDVKKEAEEEMMQLLEMDYELTNGAYREDTEKENDLQMDKHSKNGRMPIFRGYFNT